MDLHLEHSELTEANSVYHCLSKILNGFYLQNGWYVLPPTTGVSIDTPIAILPNLDYRMLVSTNRKLDVNLTLLIQENTRVITEIQNQLTSRKLVKLISDNQFAKLQKKYLNVLEPVIEKSAVAINYLNNKKFFVEIYPTQYGTGRTVSRPDLKSQLIHIQMFINSAFPPEVAVELFATAIINSALDDKTHEWREKEAISDYVTRNIFDVPNYYGTLQTMQQSNPNQLRKSIDYLRQLNLPTGSLLTYDHSTDSISLLNNDITDDFGPYEKRLIKVLIQNQGELVNFDKLTETMYKVNPEDRFSLWGITKTLQRVRDKLAIEGIPRNHIQNIKGEGYRLNT